jgi:hemerythrin
MSEDFLWKEEYSVKMEEIDTQHKRLVQLIFDLNEAIGNQMVRDKLGAILEELVKYADYHFSTEEKYFKQFNYEHAVEHIEEHRKFTEKVLDFRKKYQNNEIEISFALIDFLEDWLINHIMRSDHKYAECFIKNGLK